MSFGRGYTNLTNSSQVTNSVYDKRNTLVRSSEWSSLNPASSELFLLRVERIGRQMRKESSDSYWVSHNTEINRFTWNMLISHMQNVVRLTHDTQSLNTKQMVKSTPKVQTNSNQNNRPANLSAHVNKTCIELALGTLPCFTFHTTFCRVYNKYNGGFGRCDKLTERQRSCSLSLTSS